MIHIHFLVKVQLSCLFWILKVLYVCIKNLGNTFYEKFSYEEKYEKKNHTKNTNSQVSFYFKTTLEFLILS